MTTTINGRTPEEIKRAASICESDVTPCTLCPYLVDLHAPIKCNQKQLQNDMYALILRLEADKKRLIDNAKILSEAVKRLEAERDELSERAQDSVLLEILRGEV